MVEMLIVVAVLLAIVFLIACFFTCFFVRSEFWRLTQNLKYSQEAIGELKEKCEEHRRKKLDTYDDLVRKNQRIAELEAEVAQLDGFYKAVVTASETLSGDEE